MTILDSFRAIAIIAVVLFHYFSRWTFPKTSNSLYPYNDQYNFFSNGDTGVEFFFIISGFVIFFTLENTSNFSLFWKKRLIRLIPSIVIASIITFTFVYFFDQSNIFPKTKEIKNFIPSISFFPPQILSSITQNDDWGYMDGSYWSLWPEIQFYFLSSLLFFKNKSNFERNFIVLTTVLIILNLAVKFFEKNMNLEIFPPSFFSTYESAIDKGFNLVNYLPFFCLGICFYLLKKNLNQKKKNSKLLITYLFFLIGFILVFYGGMNFSIAVKIIYVSMIALFSIFVYFPNWLTIFENKLLSKIGISSYFLYLIHQNIGVIIIFTLGEYFLPLGFILPVLIIIVLIATSIFYTEKIDKKISFVLKNLIINKK